MSPLRQDQTGVGEVLEVAAVARGQGGAVRFGSPAERRAASRVAPWPAGREEGR